MGSFQDSQTERGGDGEWGGRGEENIDIREYKFYFRKGNLKAGVSQS